MMKNDDFKLFRGFEDRQTNERTNERTDICECRVAFATENLFLQYNYTWLTPDSEYVTPF